jgi:hypothetical protein
MLYTHQSELTTVVGGELNGKSRPDGLRCECVTHEVCCVVLRAPGLESDCP